MTSKTLNFFTLTMLFCSVGVVLGSAAAATDSTLAEIAAYRQWTRLTDKPITVANSLFTGD
jgi:hypothetical protein